MAQDNNFFAQFLGKDFSKLFSQSPNFLNFSAAPVACDTKALFETYQKNAKALSEAARLNCEYLQAYTLRCSEILTQAVETQTSIAKALMAEGSPEEKLSQQTDLIKKNYDKSLGNAKDLMALASKSNQESSDLICKRISATLEEVKSAINVKAGTNSKAKTATKKAA